MKWLLFISLISVGLLSCKSANKKTDTGIAGEYKRSSSSVTVTKRQQKIEVSICFADETCIEPCYTGLLSNAGNKRFSGRIHPEGDSTEKHLIVISFFKNELDLLFPQRDGFGMSCEPAGVYKK